MSLQDIHDIYAEPHIKSVEIMVSDGSTLGNRDIVTEKFELQDSLNSGNEITFGSCEAACLKLQVATADKEYKDLWLDVWATIQENSGDLMIDNEHYLLLSDGSKMRMHPYITSTRVGRFKVVLDEPVADRSWRNLTCYDQMYDILRTEVADWYNTLTFPMTIKEFRDSFFEYLEIEQEDVALINDDLSITGDFVVTSKLTGRPIIKAICEINGVFGHMNANGKMDYISIPSDETVEYPYYRDGTGSYERDLVEPITGIIARDAEDDAGTIVGTLTNPYIITGNPLVFGIEGTQELEDALTALLGKIGNITYRPFSVQSFGNPALPIGTSIILNTRDITIESFIETRRLTGVQGLKDNIAAKGNKERLNDNIDLSNELYQTDGRYHLLRNDVNGLESEVYDEHGNSVISQLSNEVVLKVDSNGKIVNVALNAEPTGSAFKVVADNIDFISNGKIQLTSNSLEINSTNFRVTSSGELTCTRAIISGTTTELGLTKSYEITSDHIQISLNNGSETTTTNIGGGSITLSTTQNNRRGSFSGTSIYYAYNNESKLVLSNKSNGVELGNIWSDSTPIDAIYCRNLTVYGTKSRGVETEDYGNRLMYCYETPTPMFGDVGEGKIAEDGKCYVRMDSTFNQTISDGSYQVFLQKYGQGECYVAERKADYFVVEGTAGMRFGFEIKARQAGFENLRLENDREMPEINEYYFGTYELEETDFGAEAINHISEIHDEREVA